MEYCEIQCSAKNLRGAYYYKCYANANPFLYQDMLGDAKVVWLCEKHESKSYIPLSREEAILIEVHDE